MEWVLSHMEDPGFNDPLEQPAPSSAQPSASTVDPGAVDMLQQMGFTQQQVCCQHLPAWGPVSECAHLRAVLPALGPGFAAAVRRFE